MLTHRTPHHMRHCHSGAREARARNPFVHRLCGPMDCGLVLRTPGMTNECYATISVKTPISASGAVTFGAWLASSSK